ncbi:MAG TPA: M28 family peptidase, partial [Longimicrobiales bacterium]|nr:M28 family peptidase [Longimicrobiales bacterium]
VALTPPAAAQQAHTTPPARDLRIHAIIDSVSADRIEADIRRLVGFGTRHTLSDTVSATRGIGAARRWIFGEFQRISAACGGCLEVEYQRYRVEGDPQGRIREDAWVISVTATLRGASHPDRYVIMSGDIDNRVSGALNATAENPGANDNASGMAGTIEAARVLTKYGPFDKSIVFAGLAGEEQGLYGGQHLAAKAKAEGWNIDAVLNNDMIGNIAGLDQVIDNTVFRVFSEPRPPATTEAEWRAIRFYGGEVDGPSRQVARYVERITSEYFRNLDAMMIYRLDRFGRGGHHRPFNDQGFPGVRIMEAHEHYDRQHQDLRTEDGRRYGDVIEFVDFDYARKLTGVNAAVLAALAWAPPPPANLQIGGAVQASARLRWDVHRAPDLAGHKVYWRLTTEPQWTNWIFIPWNDEAEVRHVMENLVIDNYLFGVASVDREGHESVVQFPTPGR